MSLKPRGKYSHHRQKTSPDCALSYPIIKGHCLVEDQPVLKRFPYFLFMSCWVLATYSKQYVWNVLILGATVENQNINGIVFSRIDNYIMHLLVCIAKYCWLDSLELWFPFLPSLCSGSQSNGISICVTLMICFYCIFLCKINSSLNYIYTYLLGARNWSEVCQLMLNCSEYLNFSFVVRPISG